MSDHKKGKKNYKNAVKNKIQKHPKGDEPEAWFYMNNQQIDVSMIKESLADQENVEIDVWKEMGVIEISIPGQVQMDMEWIESHFDEDESNAFLAEHQIQSLYAVNINPEYYEGTVKIMVLLCEKAGGFFCADTENFEPRIGMN